MPLFRKNSQTQVAPGDSDRRDDDAPAVPRKNHDSDPKYAGVKAGDAESQTWPPHSASPAAQVGEKIDAVARVAGVILSDVSAEHGNDGLTHYILRTVDTGLALCIGVPNRSQLYPGVVVRVEGEVTALRQQGRNTVTEVTPDHLTPLG